MAVEDNATTSKDEGLPYSSLMCRHLQSFPEPDLEVVVGANKRIYKYHALILASHSDFVDLMLSSPAAVKAKNFPTLARSFGRRRFHTWDRCKKNLK